MTTHKLNLLDPKVLIALTGMLQGAFGQVDLQKESIEMIVEWKVPDSIGSSRYNYSNGFSSIYSHKGCTYVVFTDAQRRPRIAKMCGEETEVALVAEDFHALDNAGNAFSLGVDANGYIHISGDMNHHPDTGKDDHLREPCRTAPCLYWKSDNSEDISSFSFYGRDSVKVIPGARFSRLRFVNDTDGNLYTVSRQWVRDDAYWTNNPGKVALALARYDASSETWTALGDSAPIYSEVHPEANVDQWRPNGNKVIFWEGVGGVENTAHISWGNDIFFDAAGRLHLAVGFTDDNSGFAPDPSPAWGTVIAYARSDDKGETWNRSDGSRIEGLPMRTETADIVASGHWYIMEAGVTISPAGKPLVSYRYTPDGKAGVLRWREFGQSRWKKEVTLPTVYRNARPRVDGKGVITITEYNDVYRTTDYAVEGVEHEMPYEMFALDEGFLRREGAFRLTARINGALGVVRLDITPEAGSAEKVKRFSKVESHAFQKAGARVLYDVRGRPIARSAWRDGFENRDPSNVTACAPGIAIVSDDKGNCSRRLYGAR